ncbi:MAG: homoserine O-succinyltransferase MetX [Gemmatimonadales bacterium]
MISHRIVGAEGAPAVIALGGISAGRNVTSLPDGAAGWWDAFVGPGKVIDTTRYQVLGIDWLDAPSPITTAQQADAIAELLDHLGIDRLHTFIGSSYGGMVGLQFSVRHPTRLTRHICISAAHQSHPMATALRTLQRDAVRLGLSTGRDAEGLALARGIAMTTYRTIEEFAERFPNTPMSSDDGPRFPVEGYLAEHGRRFITQFTPARFLSLSLSLDLHQVDPAGIATPTTLVAVAEDTLVPLWQMEALRAKLGGPATLDVVHSRYGHDAFLKEVGSIGSVITRALNAGRPA